MRRATLLFSVVLLAACGTGGSGTHGGILDSPGAGAPSPVLATVNYVDTNAQRIDVNVGSASQRNTSSNRQSVYYDSHTRVVVHGQDYRPTDLERSDEIAVQGHDDKGRYLADTITVTRNVRIGT